MLKWFKHKKHPHYWEDYLKHFKADNSYKFDTTRFVVFDTETTGLNPKEDRILSIGAVTLIGNKIAIDNSFERYIIQETYNSETVKIHGLLKEGKLSKISEEKAAIQFLDYIKNAVLVAHHAAFDIAMINEVLKQLELPKLKNKVLDTGLLYKKTIEVQKQNKHHSLDELCAIFKIAKHDRHTASGDAYITALIFLKIVSSLRQTQDLTLKSLFINSNRTGLL